MEEKWWKRSVVYQIYPRSFCDSNSDGIGDINGIRSKLWYLKQLGIDVIWLSPVYPSPNADNGYDISDYYGVAPEFGTMEDMKSLIKECEDCGIKIMMDLVVNHTSDEHPWFVEAKCSLDNPYRDYYIWRKGKAGQAPNDMDSCFGGNAWEYSEETGEYYLHFYHKKQPDLNWENKAVRTEIWKMMNYWIDMGIKGFRMDVIDVIGKIPDQKIKENGPKLHEYLQEMNRETFGSRDMITVGECWGADTEIGKLYSDPKRRELNMIFQFEQMQADQIPGKSKWDLKPLDLVCLNYGAMIGSALGGGYVTLTNVLNTAPGTAGVVGFVCVPPSSMLNFLIGMAISIIGGFVFTYIMSNMKLFNKELEEENVSKEQNIIEEETENIVSAIEKNVIYSPLAGEAIPMSEVPDDTFAAEVLGKGMAVIPSEGKVVAPCDAEVTALFGTKHAIGLRTADGIELLIHVGINTVELEGKYYHAYIAQGDKVKAGQLMLTFDIAEIKAAGYNITTPVIIANSYDYQKVEGLKTGAVKRMEPLVKIGV